MDLFSENDTYFYNITISEENPYSSNRWWVNKYCTYHAVNEFVLYFPFVLIFMAFAMVIVEKFFSKLFKAGLKLDSFYNLLIRESLLESEESKTEEKQARESNKVEAGKVSFRGQYNKSQFCPFMVPPCPPCYQTSK